MTPAIVVLLASVPCVVWTQGPESRPALDAAGVKRLCVPPDRVEIWRQAGFSVTPMSDADVAARESLAVPGITARAGVASPTRSPWIVANGWRMMRGPAAKYVYTVPAGKGPLALAEAFAYGADAVLKIDPADLAGVGAMMKFLEGMPAASLPPVADLAVVDDGSAITGEVLNLLTRRNLLFEIVKAPSPRFRLNVVVGGPGFPRREAADPSAFAQKVRAQLTDEQRSVRIFGSEVVIARLTREGPRARLHLLNYGGRDIEGLRIRVRGGYSAGEAYAAGGGTLPLQDQTTADGATEFSLPRLGTYAVVDLR